MEAGRVMFQWGNYEVFDFEVALKWHELTRAQAKAGFKKIMEQRFERVAMLGELVELNGYAFGTDDATIQRVNDFYRLNIEHGEDSDGYPTPDWGSVTYDVGLYLGEVLIERHPHLSWSLDTAKRSTSANQPVVVGFRHAHPRYSSPAYGNFIGYGYHIVNPGPSKVEVRGTMVEVESRPVNATLFVQFVTAASELA